MAGGRSSRMGSDKTELVWRGRRLLDHMVEIASRTCDRVVVVGKMDVDGVDAIPDGLPDAGPAGGILAAMKATGEGAFLVLACDLPLMSDLWLRKLLARSIEHRITLTSGERGLEPLCAVYSAELAEAWETGLTSGFRKLTDLIAYCDPDYGVAELSSQADNELLLNLNHPEDFLRLTQTHGT
ncbi:MAG: molybdenum cofactor guanylyltransferase [Bacteroidota bacterium]